MNLKFNFGDFCSFKNKSAFLFLLFLSISIYSNAQGINFQGVARSSNGTIIASANIGLRLSIISKIIDGTPEYVETKTVMTNSQGIFSIVVGDASNTTVIGNFKSISWADAPKFLKVEMDPTGGVNYINMGTTQLQYVPFSYYSLGVAATNVSGILPVDKGGTGVNSLPKLKAALNLDTSSLSIPTVSSTSAINITGVSAEFTGNILSDGGSTIIKSGICFDTISNPSTSSSQVYFSDPSNAGSYLLTGEFPASLYNLKQNTKYYYRTFAINKNGTAYSEVKSFTTKPAFEFLNNPTITFNASTPTITFSLKANGDTLTDFRINIYREDGSMYINNGLGINNAINDTTISYVLPDILPVSSNFFLVVNLSSKMGGMQGPKISFNTPSPTIPSISLSVNAPSIYSANVNFVINNNGGSPVLSSGICWSTSPNPDISLSTKFVTQFNSTRVTFYTTIPSLMPNTTYYVRSYATNALGTAYSQTMTFNTLINPPQITTLGVTSITNNSAIVGGSIINVGNATITTSGIIWGTNSNLTVSSSTKTVNGPSTGTFTSTITGLNSSTNYYVKAYASNVTDTYYGGLNSFTTLANVPILSSTSTPTITISDYSASAVVGGTISSANGSTITERGVLYSSDYQIPIYNSSNQISSNIDNNLSFQCLITSLSTGTTYYFRSYAKNSDGVGYGPVISVNIPPKLPRAGEVTYANVLSTSLVVASNALSNDYSRLTDKGFVWSTNANNIDISLATKISSGNLAGSYSATISNLLPNTTYFIKSYATNSAGTSYSSPITITTSQ